MWRRDIDNGAGSAESQRFGASELPLDHLSCGGVDDSETLIISELPFAAPLNRQTTIEFVEEKTEVPSKTAVPSIQSIATAAAQQNSELGGERSTALVDEHEIVSEKFVQPSLRFDDGEFADCGPPSESSPVKQSDTPQKCANEEPWWTSPEDEGSPVEDSSTFATSTGERTPSSLSKTPNSSVAGPVMKDYSKRVTIMTNLAPDRFTRTPADSAEDRALINRYRKLRELRQVPVNDSVSSSVGDGSEAEAGPETASSLRSMLAGSQDAESRVSASSSQLMEWAGEDVVGGLLDEICRPASCPASPAHSDSEDDGGELPQCFGSYARLEKGNVRNSIHPLVRHHSAPPASRGNELTETDGFLGDVGDEALARLTDDLPADSPTWLTPSRLGISNSLDAQVRGGGNSKLIETGSGKQSPTGEVRAHSADAEMKRLEMALDDESRARQNAMARVEELERQLERARGIQAKPSKRFGITSSAPAYRAPPGEMQRVVSPDDRARGRRAVPLPCARSLAQVRSRVNQQRALSQPPADTTVAVTEEADEEHTLSSNSLSASQGRLPKAVRSLAARRERESQVRMAAIKKLERRGRDTWDIRGKEKVARMQDLDAFTDGMWEAFADWQRSAA